MRIPLGPADLHVLLALSRQPMHGLEIARDVATVTGNAVVLGPATLYRTLKEMAASGLIAKVATPGAGQDPRRKYYALTPRGRNQLREDLAVLNRVAAAARDRLEAPA
jgi:DNA-binding PadR family transcriptional regulator